MNLKGVGVTKTTKMAKNYQILEFQVSMELSHRDASFRWVGGGRGGG